MDPACFVCQVPIKFDENIRENRQNDLLQALKTVSSSDSRKHACNLLDMLCNASSPLETPLCRECATKACNDMRRQLTELEAECVQYDKALQELPSRRQIFPYDADEMRHKIEQLTNEEKSLTEELASLELQEKKYNDEITHLLVKTAEVNGEGDVLYRDLRKNHRKLIECTEEELSLNTQLGIASNGINALNSMNVLDMTFFIWIHENYGTINGLRLGRLPHEKVEWAEINAAFGQVALLVQILGERVGLGFVDYEIEPKGNYSCIRKLSPKVVDYPLYGQGGWKPFGQAQLDRAIVGLMHCFIQVEQKLRELHKNKEGILAYRMEGDKITENNSPYRVQMQFNSEERWTKAMELLLLNLKRAISLVPSAANSPKSS